MGCIANVDLLFHGTRTFVFGGNVLDISCGCWIFSCFASVPPFKTVGWPWSHSTELGSLAGKKSQLERWWFFIADKKYPASQFCHRISGKVILYHVYINIYIPLLYTMNFHLCKGRARYVMKKDAVGRIITGLAFSGFKLWGLRWHQRERFPQVDLGSWQWQSWGFVCWWLPICYP